jgi:hypothetical protein
MAEDWKDLVDGTGWDGMDGMDGMDEMDGIDLIDGEVFPGVRCPVRMREAGWFRC